MKFLPVVVSFGGKWNINKTITKLVSSSFILTTLINTNCNTNCRIALLMIVLYDSWCKPLSNLECPLAVPIAINLS